MVHSMGSNIGQKYCLTSSHFFSNGWVALKLSLEILRRKVVLLLEIFSGDGIDGCLPEVSAVLVKLIPANIASALQPMDAGIIARLKQMYGTLQYDRALDALESEEEKIYRFDLLTGMECVHAVWREVPGPIIANVSKYTGVLRFHAGGTEHECVGTGKKLANIRVLTMFW